MLNVLLKSIIDQDTAPIVVCDMDSIIVYMNPSAKVRYHKDLTGINLKKCHNADSNEKIDKVLDWFKKSKDNNIIFTHHNDKENKDVYMVALRDDDGKLIGYYEKHEYRNREAYSMYNFGR
ncbi:MAG: PAS domain-containing protein [Eubacteriales bacterium]|nr:PAS domain-containing protein [Eubacteriales bacterium]